MKDIFRHARSQKIHLSYLLPQKMDEESKAREQNKKKEDMGYRKEEIQHKRRKVIFWIFWDDSKGGPPDDNWPGGSSKTQTDQLRVLSLCLLH